MGLFCLSLVFITHEYKPVYECLATFERGIPTHLLRLYKKQFYEIVFSEKPEKQLYALPGKDIDVTPNIQVVYGFGAIDKYKSAVGYTGLKAINLFRDIVDNNGNYEHEIILTKTIPELRKNTKFIPCYKYLKAVGIISDETYNNNKLGVNFPLNKKEDFYFYSFREDEKKKTINEAIEDYADAIWKVCALIPYLDIKDEELEILHDFISKNFNDFLVLKKKPDYSTYFKKLICFYDWRKYGW